MPTNRQQPRRGIEARNALVEQWLGLPSYVVNTLSFSRLTHDEALRAAEDGLLHAAELWDETRGVKFSTYAFHSIRRNVWKAMRAATIIHVPENMQREKPAPGWDATWIKYREQAEAALHVGRLRLNRNTVEDNPHDQWGVHHDPPAPDPLEGHADAEDIEALAEAMSHLTDQERLILRMRIWEDKTLLDVAKVIGLTRERVRQIQKIAVGKLREMMLPTLPADAAVG